MGDTDVSELPQTFGALKSSGYQLLPVKAEIRRNLITKLRSRETLFPGIMGFNDTVLTLRDGRSVSLDNVLEVRGGTGAG